MQYPLIMNSFCYRKIPKALELAIMELDSVLNTYKIEYVMRRYAFSAKHYTAKPASPIHQPVLILI